MTFFVRHVDAQVWLGQSMTRRVVWVSSNFKLKFVSKRSKNDSKKNVGEFF